MGCGVPNQQGGPSYTGFAYSGYSGAQITSMSMSGNFATNNLGNNVFAGNGNVPVVTPQPKLQRPQNVLQNDVPPPNVGKSEETKEAEKPEEKNDGQGDEELLRLGFTETLSKKLEEIGNRMQDWGDGTQLLGYGMVLYFEEGGTGSLIGVAMVTVGGNTSNTGTALEIISDFTSGDDTRYAPGFGKMGLVIAAYALPPTLSVNNWRRGAQFAYDVGEYGVGKAYDKAVEAFK